MAKQIATATKKLQTRVTARRISEAQYKEIAAKLREQKLDVNVTNVTVTATPIIGRKFLISEVTEARMAKLNALIRDMDAAAEAQAKATLAGTFQGLKKGDMVDLALKAIIREECTKMGVEILSSVRKLMLAQEARSNQSFKAIYTGMEALADVWQLKLPPLLHAIEAPELLEGTKIVRAPRILIYGLQANQKQPLYDKIREWGKQDLATVDVGFSNQRVADMKRNYDVIIVNKHWVGMDDVRALASHGTKVVPACGSISDVLRYLEREFLEIEINRASKVQ